MISKLASASLLTITVTCDNNFIWQVPNINGDIEMRCEIKGFKAYNDFKIQWYFQQSSQQNEIELKSNENCKIEINNLNATIETLLIIRNVKLENFGDYIIRVNSIDTSSYVEQIIYLMKYSAVKDVYTSRSNENKFPSFIPAFLYLALVFEYI